jgi:hypothetical protein
MKRIAAIIVTLVLFPAVSWAEEEQVGHVYWVKGKVFVAQGGSDAHEVSISEPLVSDTLVSTGENSAALLKFEDGQLVALQSNTLLLVREYNYDATQIKNSNVDIVFYQGGIRFVTGLIGEQKKLAFKLLTPSATIRGGNTEFMVVRDSQSTYSRVLDGKISMTNSAGTADFKAMQTATVSSPLVLATAFPASPHKVFNELLSIPLDPALIVLPEPPPPAPEPVVEVASAPEPEAEPIVVPLPVPEPVVPVPVLEPEPVPEPVAEQVPEPVAASLLAPVTPPTCTCTCTCTPATMTEFKVAE